MIQKLSGSGIGRLFYRVFAVYFYPEKLSQLSFLDSAYVYNIKFMYINTLTQSAVNSLVVKVHLPRVLCRDEMNTGILLILVFLPDIFVVQIVLIHIGLCLRLGLNGTYINGSCGTRKKTLSSLHLPELLTM